MLLSFSYRQIHGELLKNLQKKTHGELTLNSVANTVLTGNLNSTQMFASSLHFGNSRRVLQWEDIFFSLKVSLNLEESN